ncbi:MAG: alpha-amylase family glycosyl hydrolase [Rubrivivax sp.]
MSLRGWCWALRAPLLCVAALSAAVAMAEPFEQRERDWRNGPVVFQIIVDRFAPSADLDAKRPLYPAPKTLRTWDEVPRPGPYLEAHRVTAHELDFWGGDLPSATRQLSHLRALGADVLYLNPIHLAWTNHKYDALDFQQISPEYGTRDDFRRLAAEARRLGLKVVLDGVFNHMGRNAPAFQQALANPGSPYRDWFAIGPAYAGGARSWSGVQNLPELNLENPAVRRHLWLSRDSVVRGYLRDGADGWRLDTAYELGHAYLRELTDAAHREKPGSLVVGEIVNYPDRWLQSIDSVMNFTLREIILGLVRGDIAPAAAGRMTERLVRDAGIEPMLKSWIVIDNHDIPRLATQLPQLPQRRLVQALMFTLPGAPNVYYGAELGMTGGADPENRGPMRWDLVRDDNPELAWVKHLIALRKAHRALRIGDFRSIESQQLLAFERHTDRALDTRIVVVNPTDRPVRERLMVPAAHLMDDTPMVDILGLVPALPPAGFGPGFITVELPPHGVAVLQPQPKALGGYSRYKRVP